MPTLTDITPAVDDIAPLNLERTKDASDVIRGTFDDTTLLTADNVDVLATQAADEVADRLGIDNLPDELVDRAKRVAALLAAVLVELSSEEPREEYVKRTTERAEARLRKLEVDVVAIAAGDDPGPADDALLVAYSFPQTQTLPEAW